MSLATADRVQCDDAHMGVNKVDRYKWTIKDERGTYMAIHKGELFVDHAYQREQNDAKVLALAKDWSWMACGAILVAMRADGTHFVFDGQHRVMAARKRSDIDTLDCLVFEIEELQEEAKGFLQANTLRKPVTAFSKFKALLVCNDKYAIAVQRVLDEHGLVIDRNSRPHNFSSIAWALKAAERDLPGFELTMRVAIDAAAGRSHLKENLLRALFCLHSKHDALSDRKFVRRLCQVGYQNLLDGMARAAAYYKRGGDRVWASGLLDTVNHGLRNRFFQTSVDEE
jgi:hypothetical protein